MANRLVSEPSPYLRQHADNPVDWYPWGDEAFEAARRDDRPVLLSVGYSACHWCHVMAHESFENPETAELMNRWFVNIKVDREERPDVDAIYMEATQAMTGRGGWPMTVFCTPDGRPFYCGTYFPPTSRPGMTGFPELLTAVHDLWTNGRLEIDEQARRLTEAVTRRPRLDPDGTLPANAELEEATLQLAATHDRRWGGFGSAPKFPQAMAIDFLLRQHLRTRSVAALEVALTSLDAMASGGIFDHLGGGFARYSVDDHWLVPHFEKMCYDNALLLRAYLHAWQVTGESRYLQVVEDTVTYVLRDLRHPEGGFYSAEDADSIDPEDPTRHSEGAFYLWTPQQLESVLGSDADRAAHFWDVTPEGNFEGRNICNRIAHRGAWERDSDLERCRRRLFEARERRPRPGLDDKVLTEWNALMLASMAEVAMATGWEDARDAALANAEFLVSRLCRWDGRWMRSWQARAGARHLAYAHDHAALVEAFLTVYELSGLRKWLFEAIRTADALLELFWDVEDGGLFTTGHDAETLITRPKDLLDGATPSAGSVAARALLRLEALTGEQRYGEHARTLIRMLGPLAVRQPTAFGYLLSAMDLEVRGITEVVITGRRADLVDEVHRGWRPGTVLAWGEPGDGPLWEGRRERGGDGRAYVCRDYACSNPAATPGELRDLLDSTR